MITTMRIGLSSATLTLVSTMLVAGCAQNAVTETEKAPPPKATPKLTEPPLLPGTLRDGHPQSYTVKPSDDVYSVSSRFLDEPWRWKGLWNDQGQPPQIYPGNELVLSGGDQPQLRVAKGQRPLIKLTPQVRVESTVQAIPSIPSSAVAPFLSDSVVMSAGEWSSAPYIVGNAGGALLPNIGARVFARGGDFVDDRYRMYRPGDELKEPGSGDALGSAMTYVGELQLEVDGDPAEFRVIDAARGVRAGDRLVAVGDDPAVLDFTPRPVPVDTDGQIIGSLDNALAIGRYNNVVVNLGAYDGMVPGHVLAVRQAGETVSDPVSGERIQLPDNTAGHIVLYKVFDLVSYGLVAEAERDIRVDDRVGEP